MSRILLSLALTALVVVLAGIGWVVYAYISISSDDQEIIECAKARVPDLVLPKEPESVKVQVDLKEATICTKFPEIRGLNIRMRERCTIVARTPIYEDQSPTDDDLERWQAEVAGATESWRHELESAADACAEKARLRMKEEIQYWSSVASGPAPYLVGLIGFLGGLSLTKRNDAM